MWWLLACTTSPSPRTGRPEPPPSAVALEEALEAGLPALLRLPVGEVIDAFLAITDAVRPGAPCPPYLETFEGPGYLTRYFGYFQEDGRCELSSGGAIDGYAEEYLYWDADGARGDPERYRFDEVLLEGRLTSPEGYSLVGYTYLDELVRPLPDGERRYLGLVGDLAWEGPLAWSGGDLRGSWLDHGWGAYLEQSWSRSGADASMRVTGGLDGLDGPIAAVTLQGVRLESAEPGCRPEPTDGVVAARDAAGRWLVLDWGEPCDGCAVAVVDGGPEIGEVCLDLDALALELPW
jgi:hypothetical protein